MIRLTRPVLLAFVIATISGSALHFLYDFLPNPFTALLAPVNESLWEHLKLLYWPGLAAALVLTRKQPAGTLGAYCFTLLVSAFLMQLVGFLVHVVLGLEPIVFDIALYVALMALTLLVPSCLQPDRWARLSPVLVLLTVALGLALILFTFLPPPLILFRELAPKTAWLTVPC